LGTFGKTSGAYVTVIGHSEEGAKSRIRLPSGARKTISGLCRCTIGIVAAGIYNIIYLNNFIGGRTDKPILKAGNLFHKYAKKKKMWPRVRGVAMNPVDHPHGGGNH